MTTTPPFTHPDAACLGANPNTFFPEQGDGDNLTANALAICAQCPDDCRTACLNHALTYNERGIWGGTTGRQRKTMRRQGLAHPPTRMPPTGRYVPPGQTRERILEELRVNGNRWTTTRDLADILGVKNNTIQLAVRRLRDAGQLEWEHGGYCRAVQTETKVEVS